VIVQNVVVTPDVRFGEDGAWMSAKVDITFQTYEIMTKKSLATAYNAKE